MKNLLMLSTLLALFGCGLKARNSRPENTNSNSMSGSFYDFKLSAIDGKEIDFSSFKGKKVMLINVASKCGYTPQYADLQKLHQEMGEKVVLLGFPANNFGGQEPGTNAEIANFCQKNYGVTFQMFEKISVKGSDMHPLYQWLSDKSKNGWNDKAPNWNFCKYLVNEKGELTNFWASGVNPFDSEVIAAINK